MSEAEEILSLEPNDDELLYRIRKGRRVVYVCFRNPDLIPSEHRTESSKILEYLRSLDIWQEPWTTLVVSGDVSDVQHFLDDDDFPPPALKPNELAIETTTWYDFADLEILETISHRVSRVLCSNRTMILKVSRFDHEIPYLRQEIRAYGALSTAGFSEIPEFYGYVYEETQDRVVGFVMEELRGTYPTIEDVVICQSLLDEMHKIGWTQEDLNRCNWIKTEGGLRLLDLESAVPEGEARVPLDENKRLRENLLDESVFGGW